MEVVGIAGLQLEFEAVEIARVVGSRRIKQSVVNLAPSRIPESIEGHPDVDMIWLGASSLVTGEFGKVSFIRWSTAPSLRHEGRRIVCGFLQPPPANCINFGNRTCQKIVRLRTVKMSYHHHHHHRDRYEDEQVESDEALAYRLQAEEERGFREQGARGYRDQGGYRDP